MLGTVRYRVIQGLRAWVARPPGAEAEQALSILPSRAWALFRRQSAHDQRHALAVYEALRRAGWEDPHLLAAALLHDVGKAASRLSVWQRATSVVLGRLAPRLLERLGHGRSAWWNRPFVTLARHPEVGAAWAEEAGCSPLAVALIRRHHDRLARCQSSEDYLVAALQAADGLN